MILFRSARFRNFRLLRDLTLRFSTDSAKPLTVVRGENESGKTSILWAMQWVFFGDEILPDGGRDFRLHPIDWTSDQGPCVVAVEVRFAVENDEIVAARDYEYRVRRECIEEVDSDGRFTRHSSNVSVAVLTERGETAAPHPELLLASLLPKELAEVFFTDGARVLSFTGAELSQTTKRKRVQDAIRSLLGLNLLQDSVKHVKFASDDINARLKESSDDAKLQELADRIGNSRGRLEQAETIIEESDRGIAGIETGLQRSHANLEGALSRGNREQLGRDLAETRAAIGRHTAQLEAVQKQRSDLLRDEGLAAGLLRTRLEVAHAIITRPSSVTETPRNLGVVIQYLIERGRCICGESLSEENGSHLRLLLEARAEAQLPGHTDTDRTSELISASRRFAAPDYSGSAWLSRLRTGLQMRINAEASLTDAQGKYRALEAEIAAIPAVDLSALRDELSALAKDKDVLVGRRATAMAERLSLMRDLDALTRDQSVYMNVRAKYHRQASQLQAAKDIGFVLSSAYLSIQETKVADVALRMNDYFMDMIGSSKEYGLIKGASISSDFDIVVSGPQGHLLDPDHDLNGASRRALTLAFILALTTVSGVTAPSIIDTPISELSGPVRSEVFRITASASRQLVLFLTRADIRGVEDIIDTYAGQVITITNSTHFPQFLSNNPGAAHMATLACQCSHHEYCSVCQRIGDEYNVNLIPRAILEGAYA